MYIYGCLWIFFPFFHSSFAFLYENNGQRFAFFHSHCMYTCRELWMNLRSESSLPLLRQIYGIHQFSPSINMTCNMLVLNHFFFINVANHWIYCINSDFKYHGSPKGYSYRTICLVNSLHMVNHSFALSFPKFQMDLIFGFVKEMVLVFCS